MRNPLKHAERMIAHWQKKAALLREGGCEKKRREIFPPHPLIREETLLDKKKKKKGGRFIPTIEEITNECREQGYNIDPVFFFNYYKASDKGFPNDWRAALVVWSYQRTNIGRISTPIQSVDKNLMDVQNQLINDYNKAE